MSSSGQSYVRALREAEAPASAWASVRAALEDPAVFFYGSILLSAGFKAAQQQQQATGAGEAEAASALAAVLTVMSYGTIGDVTGYGELSGNISSEVRRLALPLLTEALQDKLRSLSVLSFYTRHGNGRSEVPYAELQSYLGVPDSMAMEDIMVSAVSHHLVKARMNPQQTTVHFVELLQARDVSPGELNGLHKKLEAWGLACERQLKQLDRAMEAADASDARLSGITN